MRELHTEHLTTRPSELASSAPRAFWLCAVTRCTSRRDSASQITTTLSSVAVAMRRPSGDHTALWIVRSRRAKVRSQRPPAVSQNFTVRSCEAVSRQPPSGEKAAVYTGPEWPASRRSH